MKTSKSAFDFLMRNVKAKQQQQQPQAPIVATNKIEIEISSSEDSTEDIILIDEKKGGKINQNEHVWLITNDVMHVTCHVQQFDDNDRSLLESLKTGQVQSFRIKSTEKTSDYSPLKVNDIKLGTFTTINGEQEYEQKHLFEFEKITDVSNDCLNGYFESTSTTPSYWIDLYNRISKRMDPNKNTVETQLVDDSQNQQNLNDLRRSKRRKTETNENVQTPKKPDISSVKSEENTTKHLLWTEKYQFADENEIMCNRSQLERLKQWLEQFKKTKVKPPRASTTKPTSNSNSSDEGSQCDDEDSDFSYDSDCSASTTSSCSSVSKRHKFFNNAILLNGPFGSGKTSAVYCVAKQLDFKLFECNTSSLRCKSQIIQELIGVLSSHHVGSNKKLSRKLLNEQERLSNPDFKKQSKKPIKATKKNATIGDGGKTIDSFFKQKQVLNNSTNENNNTNRKRRKSKEAVGAQPVALVDETPQETSELKVLKDSLILFDDIDVVLKEDQGFWSVISFFIKNSKKPIILTCNDEHILQKIDLQIEQIKFSKPSKEMCLNYLKTILLCESKRCLNAEQCLNQLLTYNKCDLRHSLLQLQLNTSLVKNDKSQQVATAVVSNNRGLLKFVDDYSIVDYLNTNLMTRRKGFNTIINHDPLKYDCFIYKEGLVDSITTNSSENEGIDDDRLTSGHRQHFLNQLISYISSRINEDIDYFTNFTLYEPQINRILYKFAFTHFKFTSNKALYMDYAPYLKLICKVEQLKQESNVKRRFLHYLNTTSNIGINKDDYLVLARDNKFNTTTPTPLTVTQPPIAATVDQQQRCSITVQSSRPIQQHQPPPVMRLTRTKAPLQQASPSQVIASPQPTTSHPSETIIRQNIRPIVDSSESILGFLITSTHCILNNDIYDSCS